MTKLDIISDPICPWCYIGKAHLDRALEAHPGHDFVVEWHPFQLNPDMPAIGMNRREYLEAKFGGQEGAVQAYLPVAKAAEKAGLQLNLENITRAPNTINAHRLIHWAGLEGLQTLVVDRLFKAYFRDGLDISEPDVLVDIASATGIDGAMVAMLLTGDADMEDTQLRDKNAREKGVQGVPCFIVAQKFVVSGAQPPELWERVINDIAKSQPGAGSTAGADA